MKYFAAFGSKRRRQREKVKLSLRHVVLVITCMCTNQVCGIGEMRRRKRVGREEGILR